MASYRGWKLGGLLVLMLGIGACATGAATRVDTTSPPGSLTDFAILPVQYSGGDAERAEDVRRGISEGLSDTLPRSLRFGAEVDRALHAEPEGCRQDIECVSRVGASLGVARVILPQVAELGDTVLLRTTLVDVEERAEVESRQEIGEDLSDAALVEMASAMGAGLAESFVPRRPWYRSWWPWTLLTLVAGGATAAVFLTRPETEPPPSGVIRAPLLHGELR